MEGSSQPPNFLMNEENSPNKLDPIESIFRKSNTKSQYPQNQGYDNKLLTSLLEKQDRLSSTSQVY